MATEKRCFCCLLGLILVISLRCCFAANTIRQGESINSSSSLAIKERCILGLRTLDSTVDTGYYLAIWSEFFDTVVWVGNREEPIHDDSILLSIDTSGKTMKLSNSTSDVVHLYTAPPSYRGGMVAVLEETCNFVLRNRSGSSPGRQVLWESFRHPTDSLLPGMKLGTDPVTGKKTYLVSWLTRNNPAPGAFTMEWDSKSRRLVVKRRGVLFWATSPNEFIVSSQISSPGDHDYVMFNPNSESTFGYVQIAYDGTLVLYNARKHHGSLTPITCDGHSVEHGCVRWERPACRNDGDIFMRRAGSFDGGFFTDNNASLTISDCKDICWKNCSCTGTTSLYNEDQGCVFYSGAFVRDEKGTETDKNVIIAKEASGSSRFEIRCWVWILAAVAVLSSREVTG